MVLVVMFEIFKLQLKMLPFCVLLIVFVQLFVMLIIALFVVFVILVLFVRLDVFIEFVVLIVIFVYVLRKSDGKPDEQLAMNPMSPMLDRHVSWETEFMGGTYSVQFLSPTTSQSVLFAIRLQYTMELGVLAIKQGPHRIVASAIMEKLVRLRIGSKEFCSRNRLPLVIEYNWSLSSQALRIMLVTLLQSMELRMGHEQAERQLQKIAVYSLPFRSYTSIWYIPGMKQSKSMKLSTTFIPQITAFDMLQMVVVTPVLRFNSCRLLPVEKQAELYLLNVNNLNVELLHTYIILSPSWDFNFNTLLTFPTVRQQQYEIFVPGSLCTLILLISSVVEKLSLKLQVLYWTIDPLSVLVIQPTIPPSIHKCSLSLIFTGQPQSQSS